MGIRGLTSFLKENRQSLCESILLTQNEAETRSIPVVVDAWSIIYQLYIDCLAWASGGEYLTYYRIVRRVIESWRKVGLEPTFVFDGSTPPEKHATVLKRLQEQTKSSLLFHTTSVSSRSSPSFSRQQVILPPFAAQTFIHALHSLNVATHFVPSGEADGVCVTLANQLGAYVFSRDSDFLILISSAGAGRVRGYCPLDMMMWIEGGSPTIPQGEDKDPNDWNTAGPRRPSPTAKQSYLLPSPSFKSPTLVLSNISSNALRHRLRLPASYLPLLSSLVGNDYVPVPYLDVLFETSLTVVQRIEKVARVLREQIFGPSASKSLTGGDQVVDLVRRVILKLSVRGSMSESVLAEMVETILEATFQYVLPDLQECCGIFPFCGGLDGICGTDEGDSGNKTDNGRAAKIRYAAAQKRGLIPNVTHAYLFPDRMYLWTILEDPSGPSLRSSERLREIRKASWGLIEAGLGGLRWPPPSTEEKEALKEDIALHDLLGVTTEDQGGDLNDTSEEATLMDETDDGGAKCQPLKSRTMIEYARQGSSSRVTGVRVPLAEQLDGIPALVTLDARYQIYLSTLSSNTPLILALLPRLHPLLVMTRLAILDTTPRRYGTNYSKYDAAKLRRTEVVAILKMGLGLAAGWEGEGKVYRPKRPSDEGAYPPLHPRNCGLIAHLNAIAIDCHLLAQALLLVNVPREENGEKPERQDGTGEAEYLTHSLPFIFISGIALHSLLQDLPVPACTGWRWTPTEDDLLEKCLEAVVEGIQDEVVGWNTSPRKHDTTLPASGNVSRSKIPKSGGMVRPTKGGSRFGLLEGLSA